MVERGVPTAFENVKFKKRARDSPLHVKKHRDANEDSLIYCLYYRYSELRAAPISVSAISSNG